MNYRVYIISNERPQAVQKMQALLGDIKPTWVVGKGAEKLYRAMGAERVIEGGNLMNSRNAALENAFSLKTTCVQLSDDLKGLKRAVDKKQTAELTVEQAIRLMISELESKDLYLAGVAPTANPYFYNPDKRVRTDKFIVGDFIVVRPSEQRFDTNMTLKEDYDFTMQHIVAHGGVVRYDAILAEFAHRTNSGGAVSYRTPNKEQFNIDYLKEKWPGAIVDNPKRPNEILLKPEKYQHG